MNYKNPYTSSQAQRNIENALDILKIECVTWEYPNDIHKKATKKALKAWSHRPSSIMIPLVCTHCKSTDSKFYHKAKDTTYH